MGWLRCGGVSHGVLLVVGFLFFLICFGLGFEVFEDVQTRVVVGVIAEPTLAFFVALFQFVFTGEACSTKFVFFDD